MLPFLFGPRATKGNKFSVVFFQSIIGSWLNVSLDKFIGNYDFFLQVQILTASQALL